jgi:5'-nucleotidase
VRANAKHVQLSFSIVVRRIRMVALCAAAIVAVAAVVRLSQAGDTTVDVQLLAINDFHGELDPPSGGSGRIASTDAGGVEFLATHLARLKSTNPNTFIVSAGDNIGGTPLLSSLFHDEASIEALNLAGLQLSALGNHELDEGWWELYRIQKGGCHPSDGCQDGTPFSGASFSYLAANVTLDPQTADPRLVAQAGIQGTDARPLLPAYTVREVNGIRIGFIGLILRGAASVILPISVRGLTFRSEVEAANEAASALRMEGVHAIVVLMHQGGSQDGGDINGCHGLSREIVDLVERMSDDIDVVVSGHSHQAYNCTINGKLVTSAASGGRLITDVDLRLQRSDGAVVAKTARNVVVTRDVEKDPAQSALIARYAPVAERVGGRLVGTITESLTRATNDAGESTLGDFIADAMLAAAAGTPDGKADVAFWNPGGIRADLMVPAGAGSAPVSYASVFAVLPFGNELIVKSLKGSAFLEVLEQQFGEDRMRVMQFSKGLTFSYDLSRPRGKRIDPASVRLDGARLDPDHIYRIATNNFLWGAGDGLSGLGSGSDPVTVGVGVDLLAEYFSVHSPVRPAPLDRIRRIR